MAKRNSKTAKKQNGAKVRADSENADETANVETVDLTSGEESTPDETPTTSSRPGPASKKRGKPGKLATTMKPKAAAASSSRKGGRPVKAPERYVNPTPKTPKKKKSPGASGGGEYVVEAIRGIVKKKRSV